MSHSRLIVALAPGADWEDRLDAALAPFDENRSVEPYREYVTGEPGEQWFYSKEEDGESPTWAQVVGVYNAKYGDDGLMDLDEEGRAFTMSTYNPQSKWDWWSVGGRWHRSFIALPQHDGDPLLINGARSLVMEPQEDAPLTCDGGPRRMLDLETQRARAVGEASVRWHEFRKHMQQHPGTKPWSWHRAEVEAERMTIDEARERYHGQPGVKALMDLPRELAYRDDPFAEFAVALDVYLADGRAGAVPGWALLTVEGVWMERGSMGWFGMSDATDASTDTYRNAANAYIDALDGDALLISVDVHI